MATTAHFEIQAGAEPQRFEMPDAATEITIGRAVDCQWVIPSGAVSRRHAVLRRRGAELVVEDLGSSNGTMVNGQRLTGARALRDQDKLQLGAVEIRVVIPEPPPQADATIALDATRKMTPEPVAEQTRVRPPSPSAPAPAKPADAHSGKTATETVTPRSAQPTAPPAPASRPPAASSAAPPPPSAEITPPPRPSSPPSPAPAVSPPPLSATIAKPVPRAATISAPVPATAAEATGPSMVELAIIAAGSFLVVFAFGALLIRFAF